MSAMSIAACRKAPSVGIALVASVLLSGSAIAQDGGIAIGAAAPSATVQSLQGTSVALSQVTGRGPALLEFWATWCPNCKELEPAMAAAAKKYGSQVRFVTVAVAINESFERVQKHAAAHPLPGTVVYDANGNAASAYDAPATSYVVLLDRTGRVVYTGVGGTQDLDAAGSIE